MWNCVWIREFHNKSFQWNTVTAMFPFFFLVVLSTFKLPQRNHKHKERKRKKNLRTQIPDQSDFPTWRDFPSVCLRRIVSASVSFSRTVLHFRGLDLQGQDQVHSINEDFFSTFGSGRCFRRCVCLALSLETVVSGFKYNIPRNRSPMAGVQSCKQILSDWSEDTRRF